VRVEETKRNVVSNVEKRLKNLVQRVSMFRKEQSGYILGEEKFWSDGCDEVGVCEEELSTTIVLATLRSGFTPALARRSADDANDVLW